MLVSIARKKTQCWKGELRQERAKAMIRQSKSCLKQNFNSARRYDYIDLKVLHLTISIKKVFGHSFSKVKLVNWIRK